MGEGAAAQPGLGGGTLTATPTHSAAIAALSPERGEADADRLSASNFDVLVIGGGIVGAGVALDAATRGLSVALVEAQDWAAGTSSCSSKLIHGGLRYVQSRQFGLVREALRERAVLLRLAPHLVVPAEFLYPLRRRIERPYVAAGVAIYDVLARLPGTGARLPRGRHLGKAAARAAAPALRKGRLAGAVLYCDAQVDDARLVLDVVRTAASYGARVVTRARVAGLLEDGERVVGARVQLLERATEVEVRARAVVAATGVWSEEVSAMAGGGGLCLRPSKGVHLVVPRASIEASTALIIPTRTSVLFVLPWGAHWIIGTTDTAWGLDRARPAATSSDVDYLLEELNAVLVRPLTRASVESVFVGLRPLLDSGRSATTELSREHAVAVPRRGLAIVAGGKYTTYRVMAKDALDAALHSSGISAAPSRSASVVIGGGVGYAPALANADATAARTGLSRDEIGRLLGRYGGHLDEVLGASGLPDELGRLEHASGYLRAEIAYAVTHEGARHLEDVLLRRTRIAIESPDRGVAAASEIASLMARLLGWDASTTDREVETYVATVAGALQGERQRDDADALAAVTGAPSLFASL